MAQHTFISYSRQDQEFALKLAGDLRQSGANIWMDQFDIGPGEDWDIAVENALYSCESFLFILSPESVKSKDVRDELNLAISEGKRIIPVLHQSCKIPLRIHRIQYIDFTTNYDLALTALLKALGVSHPSQATIPSKPVEQAESKRKEEEQKRKAEEEQRRKAQEEKKRKTEEERKRKAEEERIRKAEEEQKRKTVTVEVPRLAPALKKYWKWAAAAVATLLLIWIIYNLTPSRKVFRDTPKTNYTVDAVKSMLQEKGFYVSGWNKSGKGFVNDYEKQNNGQVVYDRASGLTWQQSGSPNRMNYEDAKKYIDQLNQDSFAGYSDWRLPTLEEAMSLMEPEETNENLFIDPVFDKRQFDIWTSDLYSASVAWYVDFYDGHCDGSPVDGSSRNYVRAVRFGQSSR